MRQNDPNVAANLSGIDEGLEKKNKRKYHAKEVKTLWGHEAGLSEKHAKVILKSIVDHIS